MNPAELERKLIAAARSNPPADRVPYAFEKRVIAHLLAAAPASDERELWARALWRAALACLAFMLFLGALSLVVPRNSPSNDLSQDFENTMLASVSQDPDSPSSW